MKKENLLILIVSVAAVFGGALLVKRMSTNGGSRIQVADGSDGVSVEEVAGEGSGYEGKLLAGMKAPYLTFTREDYEKALAEGKIIVLDFYANWCPICRGEEPALFKGFDGLESDEVIGFRVNYRDSDTDNEEEELAKEFKIPYQHTKVILKDGVEKLRSSDVWNADTFNEILNQYL